MRVFSDVPPAWLAVLAVMVSALGGCARQHYRLNADRETYGIVAEKAQGPLWWTPPFSIVPPPESRNHDPFDPDRPPMPPDDPAAHDYMHYVDGMHGYHGWHKDGDAASVESPEWLGSLELSEDGKLKLDQQRAVEVGLLNSRDYQTELERLYLSALSLSLERFEFDLQWFGGNNTFYDHFGTGGADGNERNLLTTSSGLGFTRNFAAGGQLLADFANTFVWQFTGTNSAESLSVITVEMLQPLLRGAFREVRLEPLTQSERSVLYSARDFARFRKQFYFNVVSGGGGYLSLLLQVQAIRNLEANLVALRENLRAHEALAEAGIVSPIQVDQVFQRYQLGRFALVRARNDLQTALDQYKIRLGLPPEMEVDLDDSLLDPFELNSPEVLQLGEEIEQLQASFRELDEAPGLEKLRAGFERLADFQKQLIRAVQRVSEDLERWQPSDEGVLAENRDQYEREVATRKTLNSRLEELRADVEQLGTQLAADPETLDDPAAGWDLIQQRSRSLSTYMGDLSVMQTQVRVYLIELEPLDWEREETISYALNNRLDMMNRQGEVVDAWRKIYVAADALESDLDVDAQANVRTRPGQGNPVAFSARDSGYRVGLRFDGPLNRKAERNIYRQELVNYQQARRRYIASRDEVVRAVRRDLRQLKADRINFEISRQSLIAAARQVELARLHLLAPGLEGDSSTTQDVLIALNSLLDAKNALIGVWIAYETDRLQLLLDTEALQLDERGLPAHDNLDAPHAETDEFELLPEPADVVFAE